MTATTGKIKLNVVQIRRICDYLNKAEWHYRRGHETDAHRCALMSREIMKGVLIPETGIVADLHAAIEKTCDYDRCFVEARDLAFKALAEVEQGLYQPMGPRHD